MNWPGVRSQSGSSAGDQVGAPKGTDPEGWGWMNSLGLGDALCLGWREVTARARWHSAVGFNLVQYLLVTVARGTVGPGPR